MRYKGHACCLHALRTNRMCTYIVSVVKKVVSAERPSPKYYRLGLRFKVNEFQKELMMSHAIGGGRSEGFMVSRTKILGPLAELGTLPLLSTLLQLPPLLLLLRDPLPHLLRRVLPLSLRRPPQVVAFGKPPQASC